MDKEEHNKYACSSTNNLGVSAAAESYPFWCFSGGLVPLHLCGRGGLTLLDEWRLLSIQSKLTTSSGCHAAQPLCVPCKSDLFDKTQRHALKRQWQCSQNPSPALWQTHSQNRCRISDSRSVTPYLASLRPCLPPRPTGTCCAQITQPSPTPSFLLTLSYYWWLLWLVWDLPSRSLCFNTRKAQSPHWNTQIVLTEQHPGTPANWNAEAEELWLLLKQ